MRDFDFAIDANNEIYLAVEKNMGTTTAIDIKLYVFRYQNGWNSLLGDPFDLANEFHFQAEQDGFYLYLSEELSYGAAATNSIRHYDKSADTWQTIASSEEFLDDEWNFKHFKDGTPFALDSSNNLYFVYGNTDSTLKDWDNPWGSATVMKYDGSSWDYLGEKRFSERSSMYFSLAIADGDFYVLCRDGIEGLATFYQYAEGVAESTTTETTESTTTTEVEEATETEEVPEATETEEETPAPTNTTEETQEKMVSEETDTMGTSPVTGQPEAISAVSAGQFVRSYSFNSIYYIDEDLMRHPFWGPKSFFTYADSFNEISWVTDATLSTMTISTPMIPKAGVVLVKIQSDPKVYAIDEGNILRWVPDEDTALTLYGASWADYVIDLEPTIFSNFTVGDSMTVNSSVDRTIMKTRVEIATAN